jgi:hypothetical protein
VAITFAGAGAEASASTGNLTLNAPASPQIGDIWIAVVGNNSDPTATNMTMNSSDWTEIIEGSAESQSRLGLWWHRYNGVTPDLLVTMTDSGGGGRIGGIASFRGCKASGSPVNVAGSLNGDNADPVVHLSITPTVAGSALLVVNNAANDLGRVALGGDYSVAFEDSGIGTQNAYLATTTGNDTCIALFYDLSVPASATGNINVSFSPGGAEHWSSVLVALEPEPETRRAELSWAEFEVPNAARREYLSWAEMESPDPPRRGYVSWAEMESPDPPRRGYVAWAEFEVPTAPRRAQISFAQMETPIPPGGTGGGSQWEIIRSRRRNTV